MKNNIFHSPTHGEVNLEEIRNKVLQFMAASPKRHYQLVVGSDSQPKNGYGVDFITAIIVHRQGEGGIYFWKRIVENKHLVLRDRIYQEATLSLTTADELLEAFKSDGIRKYDVEIHVDIGQTGQTREMIAEVVGMIRGNGFTVKTKPDAYGASKVADRHT